jgi:hypothetical protein
VGSYLLTLEGIERTAENFPRTTSIFISKGIAAAILGAFITHYWKMLYINNRANTVVLTIDPLFPHFTVEEKDDHSVRHMSCHEKYGPGLHIPKFYENMQGGPINTEIDSAIPLEFDLELTKGVVVVKAAAPWLPDYQNLDRYATQGAAEEGDGNNEPADDDNKGKKKEPNMGAQEAKRRANVRERLSMAVKEVIQGQLGVSNYQTVISSRGTSLSESVNETFKSASKSALEEDMGIVVKSMNITTDLSAALSIAHNGIVVAEIGRLEATKDLDLATETRPWSDVREALAGQRVVGGKAKENVISSSGGGPGAIPYLPIGDDKEPKTSK